MQTRPRALAALTLAGLSLATQVMARPPAAEDPRASAIQRFDSPAAALGHLLKTRPRVVAFGEYHELEGAPKVPSALRRFTDQLLPVLAPKASDLVVETFVPEGRCGKTEETVVRDVEQTTQRPATTESELVTLLKSAQAAGVGPHILSVSCADYEAVEGEDEQVDYEKLLLLIKTHLQRKITEVLGRRARDHRIIAVYGGALHNDLYPRPLLSAFTFGAEIRRLTGGRYLEVDLYVPEYIERDEALVREWWYPLAQRKARPGDTVLVRRGPGSYIILLPRTSPGREPQGR
ncbi:MAG TPA: hypothetical protein VH877_30530 [Polyangia bacterium]|nr:hypothetical protein [Polyangia bacterium]